MTYTVEGEVRYHTGHFFCFKSIEFVILMVLARTSGILEPQNLALFSVSVFNSGFHSREFSQLRHPQCNCGEYAWQFVLQYHCKYCRYFILHFRSISYLN